MSSEYIQISELAKLFNITTHTLRFYEKKGLIKPSKISKSNYRYYDLDAIYKLEKIVLLRKINIPIEKIKEYLKSIDISLYIKNLQEAILDVGKKIEELENIKNKLQNYIDISYEYEKNEKKLIIKDLKDRKLLFLKNLINPYHESITAKELFETLNCYVCNEPIIASKDFFYISTYKCTKLYLLIDELDYDIFQDKEELLTLSGGKYLSFTHRIQSRFKHISELNKLEKYIRENKLQTENYLISIVTSDYDIFLNDCNCIETQVKICS